MRYVPLLQKSLFGLQQRLQRVQALHRRTYGRPRLHRALRDAGIRISAKGVRRLMREAGIVAKGRHVFRVTTDSTHAWPVAWPRSSIWDPDASYLLRAKRVRLNTTTKCTRPLFSRPLALSPSS